MKKLTLLLAIILISGFAAFAQNSAKLSKKPTKLVREKFDPTRDAATDLQTAIVKAKKEKKRIILDVGGEWCSWCRLMDNYFIKNRALLKLRDKNFIWVKVNVSEENGNEKFLAVYPEIEGYPHLYVLEKDGTVLFSKNTSELEDGKSYNLNKFTIFLKEWSPKKK
jgi:thiol:disulfide interchange protein